jgi:hypothetical protein
MPRGSFTHTQPQLEQRTALAIAGSPARSACSTVTRPCAGFAPLQNRDGQRLLRIAANTVLSRTWDPIRAERQDCGLFFF